VAIGARRIIPRYAAAAVTNPSIPDRSPGRGGGSTYRLEQLHVKFRPKYNGVPGRPGNVSGGDKPNWTVHNPDTRTARR
jgi:hypothetical protein